MLQNTGEPGEKPSSASWDRQVPPVLFCGSGSLTNNVRWTAVTFCVFVISFACDR